MRKLFGFFFLIYAGLVFFILMILVCPFIILVTAILDHKRGKQYAFLFLRAWAGLFCLFSGIRVEVDGRNMLNTNRPYIYTGNHNSFLDAVVVALSFPQIVSPLGKIEMAKVPVFGWIYRRVVVMIDRSSRESREASVLRLKAELDQGISILVFPEGTMNRSAANLAEFYDGAFRIAIETGTDILPFVILNSKSLLPASNILMIRPGRLKVIYGTPIPVSGMTLSDLPELKKKTWEVMDNMIRSAVRH